MTSKMATENNKLNINVIVEDLQFPLSVSNAEEEKLYRDAAAQIQHRIQRLRAMYPSLPSDKYYYVMAMLNTAVEAAKLANKADTEQYKEMMRDLEKELSNLAV